jgi:hypothetical protein
LLRFSLSLVLLLIDYVAPMPGATEPSVVRMPTVCPRPPETAWLIGTDWTDEDKAIWIAEKEIIIKKCRDRQAGGVIFPIPHLKGNPTMNKCL